MTNPARLPKTIELEGGAALIRRLEADDKPSLLAFARATPAHDLLFMPRDITQEKVVDAWIRSEAAGSVATILAVAGEDGALLGCAGLFRDPLSWSPHLGELRVLVSPDSRAKGLGRALIQEAFSIAVLGGLEKITAQMTVDQKGAIAIFEELGFRGEALLKDHVRDRAGDAHDIVILSCDVERAASRKSAYA
ncbi:MAG: GNAT family N-acetyltransferase [Alphaproteobacteria bacterium]|nr:GNAT family N-acetyltransferase [Alphaproteobacteria bacterium]